MIKQTEKHIDKLKVFISYSCQDVNLADQVRHFLENNNFETIIDREDIDPAELWKDRVQDLLLRCDTVLFLLSKRSASSPTCKWEVEEAEKLGKRMIAALIEPIGNNTAPQQLVNLNYIFLHTTEEVPGSGFYTGLIDVERALTVNLSWLRKQTQLSERTLQYAQAQSEAILMRGEELTVALEWQANKPSDVAIDQAIANFIFQSEQMERRRKAEAKADIAVREAALKKAEFAIENEIIALKKAANSDKKRQGTMRIGLITAAVLSCFAIFTIIIASHQTLDANDLRSKLWATESARLSANGQYVESVLMSLLGDPSAKDLGLLRSMRSEGNHASRTELQNSMNGKTFIISTGRMALLLEKPLTKL